MQPKDRSSETPEAVLGQRLSCHRRTNQPSPHSIIIVVGWLALGALD
jgi:hypothetical protein